jgi:hypothetical protein
LLAVAVVATQPQVFPIQLAVEELEVSEVDLPK